MALADSIVVADNPKTQNRTRAAIEDYDAKADERIIPDPTPVSKSRHLDVDAVLARSLAKVVSE
jgi:hypothetical protein